MIGACHDALGNGPDADLAYERALTVARQRGAAHEIAFTVAAMAQRRRSAGLPFDEALLAEVRPLQRRLGLLLDLTDVEADARTVDRHIDRRIDARRSAELRRGTC